MKNGNGMIIKKRIFIINNICLICFLALTLFCSISWAGNKKLIQQRVQELEELNRSVLHRIPGMPRYGHIILKVKVLSKESTMDFNILQREVTVTETKIDTVNLDNNRQRATEIENDTISFNNNQKNISLTDRRQQAKNEYKDKND